MLGDKSTGCAGWRATAGSVVTSILAVLLNVAPAQALCTLSNPLYSLTVNLDLSCGLVLGSQVATVSAGTIVNVPLNLGLLSDGITDTIAGDVWTVQNAGSVTAAGDGIALLDPGSTVTNSGTIAGQSGGLSTWLGTIDGVSLAAGGSIDNQSGGSIAGHDIGIRIDAGAGNVTNAGTIAGSGGTAIQFDPGIYNDRLELQPGFAINGNVLAGGGSDELVLGGVGSGTFDLSQIGTTFRDFETFVKEDSAVWTLTGLGNQSWTATGGKVVVGGSLAPLSGDAVTLQSGAALEVLSSGNVDSTANAVAVSGSDTTIVNAGQIDGVLDGITVANAGVTMINSGTIIGDSLGTSAGAAIRFDALGDAADRLELRPGSMITGDVLAGTGAATDSFVLGGSGAASFDVSQIGPSAQYQDFDTFAKEGNSRWTLTGSNTDLMDWAVNDGMLRVNGMLSSSPFNVGTAGTLSGGGTIGALTTSGTIAPGTTSGTGVLTINGNASFGPGSTLLVGITDSGAADRLQVTGATSVDADTTVAVTALPGDYTDPSDYVVLTSGGGVTGAFGEVVDTVPDVDFVARQEANRTVLTIIPARGGEGTTTSPKEMFPASVVSAVGTSRVLVDGLRRRAGRVAGSKFGGRSVLAYDDQGLDGDGFPAAALGLKPIHKQAAGKEKGTDYRAWSSVLGRVSSVDSDGTTLGYDVTMGGVVLGIEAAPEWLEATGLVGISGGWMTSQTEAGGAQANVDAWHLALYGVSLWGPWEISGGLGVALLDYTTERWISWDGGEVRGDGETAGHAISGSLLAAYDYGPRLGYERLVFAPYASVDGAHATREGMKESGAGLLNLNVERDDLTRAWTALGLRIGTNYGTDNVQFRPQIELAWGHVIGNLSPATVSTISAANAVFVTQVAAEDRNTLQFGGNLDLSFRETFGANIRYKGEFGSASTSHRVGAGLKVRF